MANVPTAEQRRPSVRNILGAIGLIMAFASPAAMAQDGATALELQPDSLVNFTTGNLLRKGTFTLRGGTHQTHPWIDTPGTGNQIYHAGADFAPIDGLQLGVRYMNFVDPPPFPIAGIRPNSKVSGGGVSAKVRLYDNGRLRIAGQVAGELMKFDSPIFGKSSTEHLFIASAQMPLTYDITPTLQAHLTPSVALFPASRGGNPFYGTLASVGAGLTWKPTDRLLVFGTVTQPVIGSNTILADGSFGKRPVITFGTRYGFAPNSAVELFVTNGFGTTASTGALTFFPDGDIVMIGAMLTHSFGRGTPKKGPYGRAPDRTLGADQKAMTGEGFTMLGPRTYERGTAVLTAHAGTQGARAASIILAPDHFLELGANIDQLADDGSGASAKLPSSADRWAGTFKLQLMEQFDNAPVSATFFAAFGRDRNLNGTLFVALPLMREVTPKLAIKAEPKLAIYGNNEELGLGIGATYALTPDIRLIGEYTLRNSGDHIWAVGGKARVPGAPIEVGLHATNAIGAFGVNAMTSQSDPKVVLSVAVNSKLFR